MLHVDLDLFAAAQAGDRAAPERLLAQPQPDIQRDARFQGSSRSWSAEPRTSQLLYERKHHDRC